MAAALKTRMIRVLIADDQALFRKALARLLRETPDVVVVGEAANGDEVLEQVSRLKPDLVLMDLKMPRLDGVEATRRICRRFPDVRVLILSTTSADVYVVEALRAGAAGYLLKDSEPASFVSAIRAIGDAGRVMSEQVAGRLLAMMTGEDGTREYYDGLTGRELEVLRMIATGEPNKRIGFRLGISDKTVRNHISHIYEKLDIYDRSQAVLYAVRKGLVEL